MNSNYPSLISVDHESNPRLYETSYNTYPPYTDYTTASKLEAFDYNYWPTTTTTTTHNILTVPPSSSTTNSIIDQIQTPPSTNQSIETLVPCSSVHLSQINSTTTISATHHHHHIHQHVYPTSTSSNDPSNWLTSNEYQTPTSYRHCTYSNNNFYDQSQWTTPTPTLPIKFESPYTPPSYYESSHNLDQPPLSDSKDEPSDSTYSKCQEQQLNWFKPQLNPVPPKNPANGKTRTRDKYRIVYTDRQRYELENEFTISKYITIPRKAALSSTLGLSERQIKIWFQNRRAKERKLNKKRQEICSRQLNNSTDADSPSDDDYESPTYYQNYV